MFSNCQEKYFEISNSMEEEFFEKLICSYLLKKFSAFYGISDSIAQFPTVHTSSLSEFRLNQSIIPSQFLKI